MTDPKIKQVALEVASIFGKTDNVEAIIKHPSFAAASKEIRQPILDRCLRQGVLPTWKEHNSQRLKLVQVLLKAGANANTNLDGESPLQTAAREIQPNAEEENAELKAIVALLLKQGATLDFF